MRSLIKSGILIVAGILSLAVFSGRAEAGATSASATVQDRRAAVDGNGVQFMLNSDLGYKVFVATSATAIQITDETGAAPACGLLHAVIASSGTATDFAVVYDSAPGNGGSQLTAGNLGTNMQYQVAPTVDRLTTAAVTQTLDVQWNFGAWVLQTQTTAVSTTHVLWRPCRGGRN